jgi:hypothetical protein
MAINPSSFYPYNVTDTCAVWNLLSSRVLYSRAMNAGCTFILTYFVRYECLLKPRSNQKDSDKELQDRLSNEIKSGKFRTFHLDIDDLNDIQILQSRKKLSKGELSSIAYAKKIGQGFLTDDQKARKLATVMLENKMVQTTPHLFGWLFFKNCLSDSEKEMIIKEHESLGGALKEYFEKMYFEALRCRSMV